MDGTFCERSSSFLRSAFLKTIFEHYFLFAALCHALAIICILEATLEDVDAEVAWIITYRRSLTSEFRNFRAIEQNFSPGLRMES